MSSFEGGTNTKLLEAIRLLEDKGWSVIPVGIEKKALVEWKKYQKEKATREQITEWFNKYPKANFAVVTGKISNIVVVDIDPRHGGSDEYFKDIHTLIVKTGGGGWHYYFLYEEGIQNHVGILPGIDVRGEGGYVVLPPSSHKSGNSYQWITKSDDNIIASMPSFIKDLIDKQKPSNNKSKWDKKVLHGVKEGNRNNSAASVAGKLLKRFREEEWESEAWPLLQAWNATKNKPPLPEGELRLVFNSISKAESRKPETQTETETPRSIEKQPLLTATITYQQVEEKVYLLLPNAQTGLKIALAVATSCSYPNPLMLWLLFVGVPSSGKTDLVRLIKDAEFTYYLDNLTQNAFISGERSTKSNKTYDLLPFIDKKCLIIKDWTSIFSLDEKMTKKLLGDLVGIYDKEFTKFSSRRGNISYQSAFSQLGCITPATLNRHTNYMNMVGPRFLCYCMPTTDSNDAEKSYNSIFADSDRSLIEKEARLYTSSYLNQLAKHPFNIKSLSQQVRTYLRSAAELMSNCRGIVLLQSATFKNDDGEEIKYYEVTDVQIEEPWRAIQQIVQLAKYLAFVIGKDEVGIEELTIIKEVVISSMPADRSQALRAIKKQAGLITAKELSDVSDRSSRTSRRLLDELAALKVLDKIKGYGTIATDYKIHERFKNILLLDPAEFMSTYSTGTETPHGMRLSEKEAQDEPFPY